MPNPMLVMFLSGVTLVASASLSFAQERDLGTTAPAATGSTMPRSGAAASPEAGRSSTMTTGGGLGNSTNRLENGTASGKGSGPGGGSPNGGG